MTRSAPEHVLTFHPRHYPDMVAGTKRTTTRWNEDVHVGPALFVFEPAHHAPLLGEVLNIAEVSTRDLAPAAVHQPDDTDMAQFLDDLRTNYYPGMPDDTTLQVVTFALGAQSSAIDQSGENIT